MDEAPLPQGKPYKVVDEYMRIISVYRTQDEKWECLEDGKWVSVTDVVVYSGTNLVELTKCERENLAAFLKTGQEELPDRLDLEPRERYQRWKCPDCETFTVVPMVMGFPSELDMEAAERGEIILTGCIVRGDEPRRPVACTQCDWYGENTKTHHIRKLPAPIDEWSTMDQIDD